MIELHEADGAPTGARVSVNPRHVVRVGLHPREHGALLRFTDGSELHVRESYDHVAGRMSVLWERG